MFIYYPNLLSEPYWRGELSEMVFENYAFGYENDCVVFAPHRFDLSYFRQQHPSSKIIAYQTESIKDGTGCIPKDWILRGVEHADEVWDHDLDNIEILKQHGIEAKFKPARYTNSLNVGNPIEEPDIDVLFIGSPTEYRGLFFEKFNLSSVVPDAEVQEQLNFKFITAHQVYGKLKHELMNRSKIILNVPSYEGSVQPQGRLFFYLSNNKCILSKKATINYYDDLIIEYEDANDCAAKIRYLIRDDNWRKFTNYSFKEYCDVKFG